MYRELLEGFSQHGLIPTRAPAGRADKPRVGSQPPTPILTRTSGIALNPRVTVVKRLMNHILMCEESPGSLEVVGLHMDDAGFRLALIQEPQDQHF